MRFTRNGLLTAALVVAALFIGSFVTERLPQPAQLLGETPSSTTAWSARPCGCGRRT